MDFPALLLSSPHFGQLQIYAMLEMKLEVFVFDREGKEKVVFRNSVPFDDAVAIDLPCVLKAMQILYPKNSGVRLTFI